VSTPRLKSNLFRTFKILTQLKWADPSILQSITTGTYRLCKKKLLSDIGNPMTLTIDNWVQFFSEIFVGLRRLRRRVV